MPLLPNPKRSKRQCEICTGQLKWNQTKGQGDAKRATYVCKQCEHIQIVWHNEPKVV